MIGNSIRVGFFLAIRYVTRSNIWATVLIVAIMLLTFLNVVVVRGILVGLPVGASVAFERQYAGDVLITELSERRYIERSKQIEQKVLASPGYVAHTNRLIAGGVIEANYETIRKSSYLPDTVSASITGIDPLREDRVTGISEYLIEGRFLTPDDHDAIIIGDQLLDRFAGFDEGDRLGEVYAGDTVRVSVNGNQREFTVAGVIDSKVGEVSARAYILDTTLRNMIERFNGNVNEIAVLTNPAVPAEKTRDFILNAGADEWAKVETSREAQGSFLEDIIRTFDLLSGVIGFIGLTVAAITVFIVIFINAISRKRQIGILKGIGIHGLAIELSYIFLSIFYASIGIVLGYLLLTYVLQPYVAVHPINFPFSDGIIVAPFADTLVRSTWIMIATLLAGYVPARLIVRQNTINAILGR